MNRLIEAPVTEPDEVHVSEELAEPARDWVRPPEVKGSPPRQRQERERRRTVRFDLD